MADTDGLTTTVAPETTGESTAPPPSEESAAQVAEATKPDIYALLADADVDWDRIVRETPTLQGKVGTSAQAQANKLFQQWQQQQRAEQDAQMERAAREEERQLARTDPDELARKRLRDLNAQERKDREAALWQEWNKNSSENLQRSFEDFYQRPIVKEIWAKTDDATRFKLDWRNYDTIGEWNEACVDVIAEYRSDSKAEEKAKKLVEAATKSSRVEEMAGEASEGVDLGLGGMVEGGRRFRRSEINPHSPNYMGREAWKKHAAAIEYQVDNGLLIDD